MLRRICAVVEPSWRCFQPQNTAAIGTQFYATAASKEPQKAVKKNLSKAMKAYLVRAQEHDEFMKQQTVEYQIGKRHLANMMGENPETFTQDDVNTAIEYLFPSGIFEKKARPFMRPPEEVFPERKAAEFDEDGRPHHFLFYTAKPNYYQIMHDIADHINDAYKFEDTMMRKGLAPDPNLKLELSGHQWIDKESLEKLLVESVADKDYETLVATLERLAALPYSYRSKDFIMKYRKSLLSQERTYLAPKPQYDADGRAFITTYECLRRKARGHVTLRSPGTGKITINGQDIRYFKNVQCREQVSASL